MKWSLTLSVLLLAAVIYMRGQSAIQGSITLNYSESDFAENGFKKEFGSVVKSTTDWRAGDFFGKETVFGGVSVRNTGAKPMFFQYYVAFYDRDKNLVGAAGQGSFGKEGLKPGAQTQLASCLIALPKDKYKVSLRTRR